MRMQAIMRTYVLYEHMFSCQASAESSSGDGTPVRIGTTVALHPRPSLGSDDERDFLEIDYTARWGHRFTA
jgi:hypothetical protein